MKYSIYFITVLVIGLTMYIVININVYENEYLWNYRAFTALSDSMTDTFQSGDVVIVEKIEVESLQEGDIIAFYSIDPYTQGEVYTHKIRSITSYDGELAFTTYGTTTDSNDLYPALSSNVIGELVYVIPDIGEFTQLVQDAKGYAFFIIIPIIIILLLEIRHLMILVKDRKQIENYTNEIEETEK